MKVLSEDVRMLAKGFGLDFDKLVGDGTTDRAFTKLVNIVIEDVNAMKREVHGITKDPMEGFEKISKIVGLRKDKQNKLVDKIQACVEGVEKLYKDHMGLIQQHYNCETEKLREKLEMADNMDKLRENLEIADNGFVRIGEACGVEFCGEVKSNGWEAAVNELCDDVSFHVATIAGRKEVVEENKEEDNKELIFLRGEVERLKISEENLFNSLDRAKKMIDFVTKLAL